MKEDTAVSLTMRGKLQRGQNRFHDDDEGKVKGRQYRYLHDEEEKMKEDRAVTMTTRR